MDIETRHWDDIETIELNTLRASLDYTTFNTNMISTELEDFKTSLCNIEREMSTIYNKLCTWKTPKTKRIKKGEETTGDTGTQGLTTSRIPFPFP